MGPESEPNGLLHFYGPHICSVKAQQGIFFICVRIYIAVEFFFINKKILILILLLFRANDLLYLMY